MVRRRELVAFARGTRVLLFLFHGTLFGKHFEVVPKLVH